MKFVTNWKDTVQIELWKTPLERRPYGSNGDTTSRRVHGTPAEELGTSYIHNGRVSEEHEMTIRQKEMKPTRTKGW